MISASGKRAFQSARRTASMPGELGERRTESARTRGCRASSGRRVSRPSRDDHDARPNIQGAHMRSGSSSLGPRCGTVGRRGERSRRSCASMRRSTSSETATVSVVKALRQGAAAPDESRHRTDTLGSTAFTETSMGGFRRIGRRHGDCFGDPGSIDAFACERGRTRPLAAPWEVKTRTERSAAMRVRASLSSMS